MQCPDGRQIWLSSLAMSHIRVYAIADFELLDKISLNQRSTGGKTPEKYTKLSIAR